jgi:hypothetical protein
MGKGFGTATLKRRVVAELVQLRHEKLSFRHSGHYFFAFSRLCSSFLKSFTTHS